MDSGIGVLLCFLSFSYFWVIVFVLEFVRNLWLSRREREREKSSGVALSLVFFPSAYETTLLAITKVRYKV